MCTLHPCIVLDKVARLEGETHLRRGPIAMAAAGGCHAALHFVRCQHTIKKSSQGRTFRTNPHALSILAQLWTKWQGWKVKHTLLKVQSLGRRRVGAMVSCGGNHTQITGVSRLLLGDLRSTSEPLTPSHG
jgi:hypothetical protein